MNFTQATILIANHEVKSTQFGNQHTITDSTGVKYSFFENIKSGGESKAFSSWKQRRLSQGQTTGLQYDTNGQFKNVKWFEDGQSVTTAPSPELLEPRQSNPQTLPQPLKQPVEASNMMKWCNAVNNATELVTSGKITLAEHEYWIRLTYGYLVTSELPLKREDIHTPATVQPGSPMYPVVNDDISVEDLNF